MDSVSGRIAQQLYQKAKIQICGYEKADLPDSFFDLAIGNVPFGQYQVTDRQYDKLHFQIHDYFLAKTVDKLRVGGIMAFITTSGTMDKKSESVRRYLAARCDLVGAVRLPNNTFTAQAGTHTTELGSDAAGNMVRLQNVVAALPQEVSGLRNNLQQLRVQLDSAKEELQQPFLQEQELNDKSARLAELDALLNVGNDAPVLEGEAEVVNEDDSVRTPREENELER